VDVLRKKFSFAILIVLLPMVAGCSRHSKKEHYYLVTNSTKHAYWQSAQAGFAKAAAEYGVTAEMVGPADFNPQSEVAEFRSAVSRKPAGILVSVANEDLLRPEIDSAVAAGIPVITIDSDAPNSHRLYFIGTNNRLAGRLGGARVAGQLNGKGNVVFFTIAGQPNLEERLNGYKDAFQGSPAIKIVDVFDMKGDSGIAMDKAREYLARTGNDKIDAFVCLESTSAKDVAEAIKRAGALGRLLVGMDVDIDTLHLVADGTVDSTISQKPYTMAYLGLKALDSLHHYPVNPLSADYALDPYAPYPAFVDTGVALVDASNVGAIVDAEARNGVK
jgi:ribose transport system substrate-binding protein